MECFCCGSDVATGRHVKLGGFVLDGLDEALSCSTAYIAHKESRTFRSAFICESCYIVLDLEANGGIGTILDRTYVINRVSRQGKAPKYTAEKYAAFRLRYAIKHGLVDG